MSSDSYNDDHVWLVRGHCIKYMITKDLELQEDFAKKVMKKRPRSTASKEALKRRMERKQGSGSTSRVADTVDLTSTKPTDPVSPTGEPKPAVGTPPVVDTPPVLDTPIANENVEPNPENHLQPSPERVEKPMPEDEHVQNEEATFEDRPPADETKVEDEEEKKDNTVEEPTTAEDEAKDTAGGES